MTGSTPFLAPPSSSRAEFPLAAATPDHDVATRPRPGLTHQPSRRLQSVPERPSPRAAFAVGVDEPERVLRPVGDLDLAAGPVFTQVASTVVGADDVTVDLDGVRFVDAAGLGVLIGLANRLAREGSRLLLLRPTAPVRRVFGVAGLAAMLPPAP